MIKDGTLFYHGSYVGIESIDLDKGAEGKDFGKYSISEWSLWRSGF